jgi:hypothetical protein
MLFRRHISVEEDAFLLLKPKKKSQHCVLLIADQVELMRLFGRKGEGIKKWELRALLVDPHETKITLSSTSKPKRVSPDRYQNAE